MISQEGHQAMSTQIHKFVLKIFFYKFFSEIISLSQNCQCMLFSATYSDLVFKFAEQLIADPIIIT